MKKVLLSISFLILISVLIGCGGESETNTSTDTDANTNESNVDSNSDSNSNSNSNSNEETSNSQEVKTMKIGSVDTEDRPMAQGLFKFEELVEEATDSIDVEVYPNSQLGGEREIFEGLQLGTVQGATIDTGTISSFSPRFAIWSLPFLFKNEEAAHEVLDGPIGQELFNDLPEIGVVGLSYWESGFRNLTNSVTNVRTPGDVDGLKLRTMENEIDLEMWNEFGADPTPMAFPELYTALQQGVVDGQENPLSVIATNNFYEVQQHLTLTGHKYSTNPLIVSKQFWDTLSDEEKEILENAAEEAKVFERELNAEQMGEYLNTLKEEGMEVVELTDEERAQWVEEAQPVYDKFSPEIGEDLVDQLLSELGE